jgi:dynein heavy chain
LVTNINDIIENRIEKNLKVVSRTVLVDLPSDRSFSLDDFVATQRRHIRKSGTILQGKNVEIENAVGDLLKTITQYPLDPHIEGVNVFRLGGSVEKQSNWYGYVIIRIQRMSGGEDLYNGR